MPQLLESTMPLRGMDVLSRGVRRRRGSVRKVQGCRRESDGVTRMGSRSQTMGSQMIERTSNGDRSAIYWPQASTAARINIHHIGSSFTIGRRSLRDGGRLERLIGARDISRFGGLVALRDGRMPPFRPASRDRSAMALFSCPALIRSAEASDRLGAESLRSATPELPWWSLGSDGAMLPSHVPASHALAHHLRQLKWSPYSRNDVRGLQGERKSLRVSHLRRAATSAAWLSRASLRVQKHPSPVNGPNRRLRRHDLDRLLHMSLSHDYEEVVEIWKVCRGLIAEGV